MAVTRANAESVVVSRLGGLMAAAGLAVTVVGTNADLNDSLAWAHRMLGGTTADVSTVTDAELATMGVADYDSFLNLAEYRTLLNIIGNLDDVDITTGPRSEKFSQLAKQATERKEELEPMIEEFLPSTAMAMGYFSLDFAEHSEELE